MKMTKRKKVSRGSRGAAARSAGSRFDRLPATGTFVVQREISGSVLSGRLSFSAGAKLHGFDDRDAIVISGDTGRLGDAMERVVMLLPEVLKRQREKLSQERIKKLIEAIEPDDPMDSIERSIDEDNATLRLRFVEEVPCLTSEKIHAMAGHKGRNRGQTASAWKRSRRVFSVPFRNRQLYPAFQFADGKPKPIIKETLSVLPEGMSPWQTAFWFVSGNGWLDGATPKDALDDGNAVLEAARMEAREVVG